MNIFGIITMLIVSYLVGSIPNGYLIGKIFKKVDIRTLGSKNTGATNTMRVLGLKYGILALVLDGLKGVLVIAPISLLKAFDLYLIDLSFTSHTLNILSLYGVAAVIGHIFPIYLGFKGGKAVATSFGVLIALLPWVALAAVCIFVVIVLATKYVSLASVIAAGTAFIITIILVLMDIKPIEYLITFFILFSIIVLRHRSNFKRLQEGTENKI